MYFENKLRSTFGGGGVAVKLAIKVTKSLILTPNPSVIYEKLQISDDEVLHVKSTKSLSPWRVKDSVPKVLYPLSQMEL